MMTTTQNMIASVPWLDTASHTVRLDRGSLDEGMTNGNIAKPAVRITPALTMLLAMNAAPARPSLEKAITASASRNDATGASIIQGRFAKFSSHVPCGATVLAIGAKALDAGGIVVMRYPVMPTLTHSPARAKRMMKATADQTA